MKTKNNDRLLSLLDIQHEVQFINEGLGPVEGDEPFRAEVGFISRGSAQSAVYETMTFFRKIKFPAAALYLKSLRPFPIQAIEDFAGRVNKIVVIEESEMASLSKMIREATGLKSVAMVPPPGGSIKADDIFKREDWN